VSERWKDWFITGGFVGLVTVLVALGWMSRDHFSASDSGEAAPLFEATALNGSSVGLQAYAGKVILLNIWATWCPPCRQEMPSLERLHEELGGRGLSVVAVSVDESSSPDGTHALVQQFVKRYGLKFPVLLDPRGHVEDLYGVDALPTTFLIDREGRIRKKVVGGANWDRPPYSDLVRKLLGE
jgi:cytochrome c biogenesis protein CcmG, thiol:disulfide interchange protein DsbE